MTVQVCTVWCPRPKHEKWRDDYLHIMALQKQTAERFGHDHLVVTDGPAIDGFNCLTVRDMPDSLMRAMIAGAIERLAQPVDSHILLVDVDVLIAKPLDEAFTGEWDLGLTYRENEVAPINNGVMYLHRGGENAARRFFSRALARCKDHWGGDQEAISQEAQPVPQRDCVKVREGGLRLGFLNTKKHAAVPKAHLSKHDKETFAVHFKGDTKKWLEDYANNFLLKAEA